LLIKFLPVDEMLLSEFKLQKKNFFRQRKPISNSRDSRVDKDQSSRRKELTTPGLVYCLRSTQPQLFKVR